MSEDFIAGTRTTLVGLTKESLNGQAVTVLKCEDPASDRIAVRLDSSGKAILVKPTNLAPPSSVPSCAVCNETIGLLVCGGCKAVHYCSRDHQRRDWRAGHKSACQNAVKSGDDTVSFAALSSVLGGDAASVLRSFQECSRCLGPCSSTSRCQIEHPIHLRQDCGSTFQRGSMQANFVCTACNQSFSESTAMSFGSAGGLEEAPPPVITGARFCYDGPHSADPLDASDERRIVKGTLNLVVGPGLQAQLSSLPADLECLTVNSSGCYDDRVKYTLDFTVASTAFSR